MKWLGCPVVLDELRPLLPPDAEVEALDAGLHVRPDGLRTALQRAVDETAGRFAFVVLAYGLCSGAVEGLRANGCTLVVPNVDDCIGLFLGSREAYRDQVRAEPGTYYLTGGWIDAAITPFADFERSVARWGEARALRLMQALLKHYTRLAFVRTGVPKPAADPATAERHERYTRDTALRFGLRPEVLEGSGRLLEKLANGPWDQDFVLIPPGRRVHREAFRLPPP